MDETKITSSEDSIAKLAAAIEDISVAMMTTVDPDGVLRSRPMATQEQEFDGTLWFFTRADSGKVESIEHDQHVNISYSDVDGLRFASVAGRAQLVRDENKVNDLWSPILKAWFPDGPSDPQIALIRVQVDSAEIWDAPEGKFVQLLGFVKAISSAKPYDSNKPPERVDLKH